MTNWGEIVGRRNKTEFPHWKKESGLNRRRTSALGRVAAMMLTPFLCVYLNPRQHSEAHATKWRRQPSVRNGTGVFTHHQRILVHTGCLVASAELVFPVICHVTNSLLSHAERWTITHSYIIRRRRLHEVTASENTTEASQLTEQHPDECLMVCGG